MENDYQTYINRKAQTDNRSGFEPLWIPDSAFDFQKALIEWSIRQGCGALFEECGLGKTLQELVWAENVVRKTNGRVLIFTPLAVGHQFVSEGEKFGIECKQSRDGKLNSKIVVTNYQRAHYFNPDDFVGVVGDESGIFKNFKGVIKNQLTDFMRKIRFRLLASATPAPNDYIELGNSSEVLGHLGYIEMLGMFFKADNDSNAQGGGGGGRFSKNPFGSKFRFRGHAERDFWRWVCSWARALRKPSDLGFDDGRFILPPLTTEQHIVQSTQLMPGYLLPMEANGLSEQRDERKRTVEKRCEKAAERIIARNANSIAWGHLDVEGDLLEKLIPDCVQVSGKDCDEEKEEKIEAFQKGQIQHMTTKPTVAGFGLNMQHCSHQTFFPSHSYEQWHQCIRRSWRFGQLNPVHIDVIASEGESRTLANQNRKEKQAGAMMEQLVSLMNESLKIQRSNKSKITKLQLPSFLK